MRNRILGLLFSGLSLLSVTGRAQQGKDLAFTTATSTVVNVYTTLSTNALVGSTNINVASAAGIGVGDLVLLIQMQGASINAYRDTVRPWPALDSTNSYVLNGGLPYGKVLNISSCGNNEFAEVNAVSGNAITLDCGLKNEYDVLGHVQVIRVPRYASLTLNSGAIITCPQWNGSTGGVIAIEVQGNTTINTGGKIDASGLGFRGAAIHNHGYVGGVTNDGNASPATGAWKGEGVFGDTAFYRSKVAGDFGHGAMANGGGGGNDDNAGGGGGANAGNYTTYPWTGKGVPDVSVPAYVTAWNLESASFATSHSSGGGRGGYTYSNANKSPQTVKPDSSAWNGDARRVYGGMGGEPLDYSTGKIFLGGGGGAGDENDGYAGAGGNGGGIVFLLSYGTVTGGGQILANGNNGSDSNSPNPSFNNCTGRDGAGGAGAGGAVVVNSVGSITLTNALAISAAGGKGGSVNIKCNSSTNHDGYGPGGGGGGGYVATSNAVTNSVLGGANGIITGSGNFYSSNIVTNFPPNGATKGDAGISATIANFYLTASNYTICAGSSASLTVTANGAGVPNPITYNWYTAQTGGSAVTGNPYNTGALSVGTYTYYAGTCPGTYRIPVIVTVLTAPTVSVVATPTAVCPGQTVTLTASGASSYTWSANAGGGTTNPTTVTPVVNTTYTITGANGTCTNSQTVAVVMTSAPTLTVTATPTAVCAGQTATLTASGATSYTWSANAGGGTTSSTTVTPSVNTTYTVTGGSGTCTGSQTVAVVMTSAPTLTVTATPTAVCAGQSTTLTATGATSYTWSANAGGVQTPSAVVTPTANTTYVVTGDNGGCTSTQSVTVNMNSAPTLTVIATPTAVCSGSSATLTAGGATSYTWSANAGGVLTSTAVVTPTITTTYNVTGDNGGCTSTQTVSVAMASPPTLTITATPAAICNGASSLLTASGASSYTWSANAGGGNAATTSVNPTITTTYTLTGDSGGCVSTQMIAVVVNNGPTAADSSFVSAACGQANGSYSLNSVTGGTAGYQVNFNNTGLTAVGSFPYTVSNLSAGIYPVVIQDNNGCTYTTSININNTGGITKVDSTIGDAVCNPPNSGYIVLTAVTGGTGPYQVEVNGGGFTAIASFPDTVKNLTAGNYTVGVKDNAGCLHSSIISVGSIGGITQVNTSTQNAVCNPAASGAIVISSVNGGTSPFQYSLNGGPLTNIAFPDSIKNLVAGSYTLTIQDAAGCSSTSTLSITSPNGPGSASGSTANDTCSRSVGALNVLVVLGGAPAYQYSLNGGAYQSSAAFSGLAAGIYTVSVKDNNGCTITYQDTVNMTAIPSPTVTAAAPAFCQGGSTTLSSSSASGNTWNTTATTQTIIVNAAGPYWVSLTQNGCTVTSNTVSITVNPNPTITVNSDSICQGTSTTLSATVSPAGGTNTYNWTPSAGLSSTSGSSVTANPVATAVYTVTVQDANSCFGVATTTVVIDPVPAALVTDTFLYCLYQNVSPLAVTPAAGDSLHWYTSNQTPLSTAPTPSTNILGVTTYYVSQSSTPGNCEGPKTPIVVMVIPAPSAAFVTDPAAGGVFTAQTVTFTPTQTSPYFVYLWNFGEPTSGSGNTSNQPDPTHAYMSAGIYCPHLLVISLQTGCADSNTVCIDVFNGIHVTIPNVFTPNQDGVNEVFSIKTEGITELACDIYDRWGVKLYGWNDPKGYWDGTTNGKQCPDGTYFYVVSAKDVKGITKSYKGYVQLIK